MASNLTRARVEAFKRQTEENEAGVGGLPPAYIVGFSPSIGTDGLLTIGPGVASIQGQRVDKSETVITESHWDINRLGSFTYYLYLDRYGGYHVDIISPIYAPDLLYPVHKILRYRYIATLKLNSQMKIQWAQTLLQDEIAAQNLAFINSVGTQTRQAPESGDIRIYVGKDPEGDQDVTDPIEIAIKEFNSENWETRFNVAVRSGGNVVDQFVSGFLKAGEGVLSSLGRIWKDGTNSFAGSVQAMAFGNNVIVAGSSTAEIERSTDGGETFSTDISNNHTLQINNIGFGNNVFIAVGDNGELSRSTDNGASWGSLVSNAFATASDDIDDIAYDSDAGIWVIVGEGTTSILRSDDDGVTWSAPTTSTTNIMSHVAYIGNNTFVAMVASNGQVYRSTDSGDNWFLIATIVAAANHGFAFSDGVLLASFAVLGANWTLYRSIDSGENWTQVTWSTSDSAYDILSASSLFFIGDQISTDGGQTFSSTGYAGDVVIGITDVLAAAYDSTLQRIAIGGASGETQWSQWLEAGAGVVQRDIAGTIAELTMGTGDMLYSPVAVANTSIITGEYIFDEDNELDYSSSFTDGMSAATVTFTELPTNTVAVLMDIELAESGTTILFTYKRTSGGTAVFSIRTDFADSGTNQLHGTYWLPTGGNSIYATNLVADSTSTFRIIGYKTGT